MHFTTPRVKTDFFLYLHLGMPNGKPTQIEIKKRVVRVPFGKTLREAFPDYAEAWDKEGEAGQLRWFEEHQLTYPDPGDPDYVQFPLTLEGIEQARQCGALGGRGGQTPSSG